MGSESSKTQRVQDVIANSTSIKRDRTNSRSVNQNSRKRPSALRSSTVVTTPVESSRRGLPSVDSTPILSPSHQSMRNGLTASSSVTSAAVAASNPLQSEERRRSSLHPNFYGHILESSTVIPQSSFAAKAPTGSAMRVNPSLVSIADSGAGPSSFSESHSEAGSKAFSKIPTTFRGALSNALELGAEQRGKYGKFRKDEKRAVMELYEMLGLDEDTFLTPPNELQRRIADYHFPPQDMHMLRDVEVVSERVIQAVLGEEETSRRREEGMEVAPVVRRQDAESSNRRDGVSSEGTSSVMKLSVFKNIPKNKEQSERLMAAIRRSMLFAGFEAGDIKILFQAFELEEISADTTICEQGEQGDRFYLIDSGRCRISVEDKMGVEVVSLFVGEGDTFGELAIMYGTPRAATVRTVVDTVVWWIDRDTYRGIILKETLRKRERYIAFLESVPLFSSVDKYEKARIADVLEVQEVQGKGSVILKEGDPGDTFFLIEEGEVRFETLRDGIFKERGRPGDFFGEMALLFNRPRMATVTAATSRVRLLTLNRNNFTNYLGPFEEILRRNADQYKQMVAKARQQQQTLQSKTPS